MKHGKKDINALNKEIGQTLWQMRFDLGLTRSEIAKDIGVSHQQFEKYEKGTNRISVGTLVVLLQRYQVKPEMFFQNLMHTNPDNMQNMRMCMELTRNFRAIKEPLHQDLVVMATRILSDNISAKHRKAYLSTRPKQSKKN